MKSKKSFIAVLIISSILGIVSSCEKLAPPAPAADELLNAPLEELTSAEYQRHLDGAAEFDEIYVPSTGLGSLFVDNSCSSCHAGAGKGHASTTLTRFGQTDTFGNKMLLFGAPQLQNRALPGFLPETLPIGASAAKFNAPIIAGLGFLELVPDQDLLALSDPNDLDGNGISGVPNWNTIPNYVMPHANSVVRNGKYINRFGKKASVYNLLQQTASAFNQDMGITSTYEPKDPYTLADADPEVTNVALQHNVFYLQTLQMPIQRTPKDAQVIAGQQVFKQIGCENCHKETLKTGYSPIAALSQKEFHPYTDLLLHDMGGALNDNYTEGSALTAEWRTAPLWGLGLSPTAQGGNYFLMHDGRAKSIEEAIELHGGESTASRNKYQNLTAQEKSNLVYFLKSL